LSAFAPKVAAEKLIAGDIGAAFIVTGWESPVEWINSTEGLS
jgi:hypothetical protein